MEQTRENLDPRSSVGTVVAVKRPVGVASVASLMAVKPGGCLCDSWLRLTIWRSP